MSKRIQHHTVTIDLPIAKKTKDEQIAQLRALVLEKVKAEAGRDQVQDLIDCARGSALLLRSLAAILEAKAAELREKAKAVKAS